MCLTVTMVVFKWDGIDEFKKAASGLTVTMVVFK